MKEMWKLWVGLFFGAEGYIDLYHSTPWTAIMTFQENDDIDIFGAITGLDNNTLSVILLTIISNITYNR